METKIVNLGELGMGFKELGDLADMLAELAEKGTLYGEEFDLDTLKIVYKPNFGVVDLYDDYGATTAESDDDEEETEE